jgi:hypothetical protein
MANRPREWMRLSGQRDQGFRYLHDAGSGVYRCGAAVPGLRVAGRFGSICTESGCRPGTLRPADAKSFMFGVVGRIRSGGGPGEHHDGRFEAGPN